METYWDPGQRKSVDVTSDYPENFIFPMRGMEKSRI